ncbi:hypothetical protein AWM75_03080 [Aerococcus urinaehominis]|uniref:Uncharacterized protein n=1 Tax=Aerococcus urinaehominis TaxID=128944 RepID=A0A0X8FKM1_9LACT|nr:aromatic acid exporter family protein [Aerococcus urinaehominis]AMB99044.1 hypothetical protein AWM75_03080 [Aerococcus urinaehominis]SDM50622.1 Aromatic acid exporter family member 1 [Aerococcus urinaehominis]
MKSKFHIGMRTFKTGLSIFLIAFLYNYISYGSPQIAGLGAVFSQRANLRHTAKFGLFRSTATSFGALSALVTALALDHLPNWPLLSALAPGLGIIMTIVLCNAFIQSEAIVGGAATFLIIFFNIPEQNQVSYALLRVLDTFVGALIASLVELCLPKSRTDRWFGRFNR